VLTHATGLVSHYADTGAWRSRAVEQFERRFAEEGAPWVLRDGELPLDLGRGAVLWPDFTARAGDRVAHLQILGHWKEEPLREHLARLDARGPENLLVVASRKLRGDQAAALAEHPRLLWFADVIPPAAVRKRLDALVPP
jgi:predicted nuclease of restriction endonuclease-like RecB superfamily